jgi:hypothetical protein
MSVVTNENSPMLRRIRILVDPLRDHLSQPSLFSKPFSGEAADRVPSNLHRTTWPIDNRLSYRDDIGLTSETHRVLQCYFTFIQVLFPIKETSALELGSSGKDRGAD